MDHASRPMLAAGYPAHRNKSQQTRAGPDPPSRGKPGPVTHAARDSWFRVVRAPGEHEGGDFEMGNRAVVPAGQFQAFAVKIA